MSDRPTGPFGLPRLTDLGPFVEPADITPNHDTPPGIYPLETIEDVQPETAIDTAFFLGEGKDEAVGLLLDAPIAEFEYKQINLGKLLADSEFSAALMQIVQRDSEEVKKQIQAGELDVAPKLCTQLQLQAAELTIDMVQWFYARTVIQFQENNMFEEMLNKAPDAFKRITKEENDEDGAVLINRFDVWFSESPKMQLKEKSWAEQQASPPHSST